MRPESEVCNQLKKFAAAFIDWALPGFASNIIRIRNLTPNYLRIQSQVVSLVLDKQNQTLSITILNVWTIHLFKSHKLKWKFQDFQFFSIKHRISSVTREIHFWKEHFFFLLTKKAFRPFEFSLFCLLCWILNQCKHKIYMKIIQK